MRASSDVTGVAEKLLSCSSLPQALPSRRALLPKQGSRRESWLRFERTPRGAITILTPASPFTRGRMRARGAAARARRNRMDRGGVCVPRCAVRGCAPLQWRMPSEPAFASRTSFTSASRGGATCSRSDSQADGKWQHGSRTSRAPGQVRRTTWKEPARSRGARTSARRATAMVDVRSHRRALHRTGARRDPKCRRACVVTSGHSDMNAPGHSYRGWRAAVAVPLRQSASPVPRISPLRGEDARARTC